MSKNLYAIEMRNITKRFGRLVANDSINLLVKKNTIHGLLGENGAGKSTLMSVLFGLYNPDGGKIFVNGEPSTIKSPLDAAALKIGMVHQHFKLVEIFKPAENVFLGSEPTKLGFLNKKSEIQKIKDLAKKYNFDIDFSKKVGRLSVGQKQKIEILKTLYRNADILIFDEPTAVLTPKEITGFLNLLKDFKKEGKTIIIITHKLDEIKAVCDEATIIRKGKFIKTINVKKTSEKQMSALMVGKSVDPVLNVKKPVLGKEILKVENLTVKKDGIVKLNNANFSVREGEIVAIAGVEGNGQTEIMESISGLSKKYKGKIDFLITKKENVVFSDLKKLSIKKRIRNGMSIIPEDRHKHGLILDAKLYETIVAQEFDSKENSFFGIIKSNNVKKYGKSVISGFDVRGAHSGEAIARDLSGGNQQKAIVGRELNREHKLLLVAQPTRGLDVGAINHIHKQLLAERDKKRGVLLISYELSEIMALADRVIVLNKGNITGEVPKDKMSRNLIGDYMLGAKKDKGGNNE